MNPGQIVLKFANAIVEKGSAPDCPYSTWDYNNVLICEGIEQLGNMLNQPSFLGFKEACLDRFDSLVRQIEGSQVATLPPWLAHYRTPSEMWHCGLIALVAELQRTNPLPDRQRDLVRFASFLEHVPVLEDGTLVRLKKNYNHALAIQIDDIFMLVPYWLHMWKLTGKAAYLSRAVRETKRYFAYLWDEQDRLLHCLWLSDQQKPAAHYWCRGNGWFAVTIAILLSALPDTHPDRHELLAYYRQLITGWRERQDANGLWHQVLTRPDSYAETSGSAMITYCMLKGINEGWLDASFREVGLKGWKGLLGMISEDGTIRNVCKSTDMSEDIAYFLDRPHEPSGAHAIGPILLAAVEAFKLEK